MHLNWHITRRVQPTGEKTVAVNIGEATSSRFIFAVSIGIEGIKVPLVVMFKGQHSENCKNL